MSQPETVTWLGNKFNVYGPDTTWREVPGIYIFAKPISPGRWSALYVGQTGNFRERLANHERWPEAQRKGATCIHARVVDRQAERDSLEELLIRECLPPLNVQPSP